VSTTPLRIRSKTGAPSSRSRSWTRRLIAGCEGHALAAEAGIACLLRRTYKNTAEPAPAGAYDFINYFECADADVPTFHQVCAALRDVGRNPEWKFVREGPTWHGRRVATWEALFAP
jgi:hypothetical protein